MNECPVCKKANDCKMEQGLPVHMCWCSSVTIPEELLIKYNTEDGCICKKCIEEYVNGQTGN